MATNRPLVRANLDKLDALRMGVNHLAMIAHDESVRAGWYTPLAGSPVREDGLKQRNVGEMLALIHSEISEALEGYRKSAKDDKLPHRQQIEVELADALLRIGDLAGYLGLDLGGALFEKVLYNRERADHKPEARAAEGGKKF